MDVKDYFDSRLDDGVISCSWLFIVILGEDILGMSIGYYFRYVLLV